MTVRAFAELQIMAKGFSTSSHQPSCSPWGQQPSGPVSQASMHQLGEVRCVPQGCTQSSSSSQDTPCQMTEGQGPEE